MTRRRTSVFMAVATPDAVLAFWFEELSPKQWFKPDAALDRDIAARFGETLEAAAACELWPWRETATGRLAEIIVLDQFSRNIHRDTAGAFANDTLALALAQELVRHGHDAELSTDRKHFAYMPYMHSESPAVHAVALRLYAQAGLETPLRHEREHWAEIERFGRYPRRNAALDRVSTEAERRFLETGAL